MDDADRRARPLDALREPRRALALDDFGTGYSSLALPRALPVDSLKIDRSFVDGSAASRDGRGDRRARSSTWRTALGLDVVAEGVETDEQSRAAARLGCDRAQGYLFAPPMSAADLEELLAAGPVALLDPAADRRLRRWRRAGAVTALCAPAPSGADPARRAQRLAPGPTAASSHTSPRRRSTARRTTRCAASSRRPPASRRRG